MRLGLVGQMVVEVVESKDKKDPQPRTQARDQGYLRHRVDPHQHKTMHPHTTPPSEATSEPGGLCRDNEAFDRYRAGGLTAPAC